jgi:peptide deformylase
MLFKKNKSFQVRVVGDPVLKENAARIDEITPEIREFANDMLQTVKVFDGIGLAAPQVGVSKRMVILDVPMPNKNTPMTTPGEMMLLPRMPMVLINPEIIARSPETIEGDEGCLSVPDIYAPVVRNATVTLKTQTLEGENIEVECGGLLGRCIQHELDHLDGYLFLDRLDEESEKAVRSEVKLLSKVAARHNYIRTKR